MRDGARWPGLKRLTRRRLLRLAGGGLAIAAGNLYRPLGFETRAAEVNNIPEDASGQPFNTLIVRWNGDPTLVPEASVSVLGLDGAWSNWNPIHEDHHASNPENAAVHFNPIFLSGTDFRVQTPDEKNAGGFEVITLDTSSIGAAGLQGMPDDNSYDLIDGFIIPRAGWNADESYRREGQDPNGPIAWPPTYSAIDHVLVHHTETEFGWEDPAAVVRSVYYYHAVILDWGDIGYNFLIDAYGNVYEGRYGGPNVIGGHAREYNYGSIGIALIGSYMNAAPTAAAKDALVQLIRTRAGHVDPAAAGEWIDWVGVPNICGHGDVMATACPGSVLQDFLPEIRGRLAGTGAIYFPPPTAPRQPAIVEFSAAPTLVNQGDLVEIRAKIANISDNVLVTQGPDPGFVYEEDQNFESTGNPKIEGRYRLAVEVSERDGVPNPYRWGFGEPIEVGEEREIVGYIRMSDIGTKTLVPTLVREFVRYFGGDADSDAVHVVHPLVSRVERDLSAGGQYVDETGHIVPAVFQTYWAAHGGLNRFGFPLTEAFDEKSATDGETYLTQYFERARFEYHPELASKGDVVKLGLLGAEAVASRLGQQAFQPVAATASTAEMLYFPETGHTTSYRFLETWISEGGLESFGYPISEKFEEASLTDGSVRLVQYFERARFEYHPDDAWDKQIKLGHLGREVLIRRGWLPAPGVEK